MTDRHGFVIEIIDIEYHTPYIQATDPQIRKLAAGRHSGETLYDIAAAFAAKLQQTFDAKESTISKPNPERNYWLVYVPIQGGLDNSVSKVCISFYVSQHQ